MRTILKSLFLVFCCAHMALAASRDMINLTIITDPALLLPVSELVRHYSTEHRIAVSLVSSEEKDAETLIGEGMEAHILLTADTQLVERLQHRGMIDVFAQNPLVTTDLVLVRRKEERGSLSGQWTLANLFLRDGGSVPIFLLDPTHYTEGERSIEVLDANEVSADNRIILSRKRELIERLKSEESAGILLASDAFINPELHVVSILPEAQYEPILFTAPILASEAMTEARKLVKFLSSKEAAQTFERYGFKRAAKPAASGL